MAKSSGSRSVCVRGSEPKWVSADCKTHSSLALGLDQVKGSTVVGERWSFGSVVSANTHSDHVGTPSLFHRPKVRAVRGSVCTELRTFVQTTFLVGRNPSRTMVIFTYISLKKQVDFCSYLSPPLHLGSFFSCLNTPFETKRNPPPVEAYERVVSCRVGSPWHRNSTTIGCRRMHPMPLKPLIETCLS